MGFERLSRICEVRSRPASGLNSLPSPRFVQAQSAHFMTKTAERWGRVRDRFGRSYVGRISQHRIINFSIRRTGSRGTFDGVIGLSAFDYIDRFYTNLTNPGPGTLIALVRDDGELLAGNDVARGSGVPSA